MAPLHDNDLQGQSVGRLKLESFDSPAGTVPWQSHCPFDWQESGIVVLNSIMLVQVALKEDKGQAQQVQQQILALLSRCSSCRHARCALALMSSLPC